MSSMASISFKNKKLKKNLKGPKKKNTPKQFLKKRKKKRERGCGGGEEKRKLNKGSIC